MASSPIIFGPLGPTAIQTGGIILPGSTSGTLQVQPAMATTSYAVTMPATQGTGALTNNGSGVLSWSPTSGPTGSYAQSYFDSSTVWSNAAPAMADLVPTGTSNLVTRQSSGISLTKAAGNLPGIIFTPASSSAIYHITASVGLNIPPAASGAYAILQLTDGTTPIVITSGIQPFNTSNLAFMPQTLSGIYVPGTASPVTVKFQMQTDGSNICRLQSLGVGPSTAIEWTVVRIV